MDGVDEIKVRAWISIHREDLFADWELLTTEGKFFKIEPLNDKTFFNQVRVDYGTLVWPNEIDVGPEDVWEFADFTVPETAQEGEK